MGTRSLTLVEDERGETIINMYRHYDGYLEGHGKELAEFLSDFTIVNGLPMESDRKLANGITCLAAQIVAHFKTRAGDIYLYAASERGIGEEFIYRVLQRGSVLHIQVEDTHSSEIIFSGTPIELLEQVGEPLCI